MRSYYAWKADGFHDNGGFEILADAFGEMCKKCLAWLFVNTLYVAGMTIHPVIE